MKSPSLCAVVGDVDCSATWLDPLNVEAVEAVEEGDSSRPRVVSLVYEAFLKGTSCVNEDARTGFKECCVTRRHQTALCQAITMLFLTSKRKKTVKSNMSRAGFTSTSNASAFWGPSYDRSTAG